MNINLDKNRHSTIDVEIPVSNRPNFKLNDGEGTISKTSLKDDICTRKNTENSAQKL